MGKGLRSNSKKRFRTLKRENVKEAPHQLEGEARRQEALQAVLAAPRPSELAAGGEAAADTAAAVQQEGEAAMAVDGQAEGTTNPGKLLKKLRKQRLAATKGIIKGQTKRNNPLAGANQFHKRKGKKRG